MPEVPKNVPVVELDTIRASDVERERKTDPAKRRKNSEKGVKNRNFRKCIKILHPKLHPERCYAKAYDWCWGKIDINVLVV